MVTSSIHRVSSQTEQALIKLVAISSQTGDMKFKHWNTLTLQFNSIIYYLEKPGGQDLEKSGINQFFQDNSLQVCAWKGKIRDQEIDLSQLCDDCPEVILIPSK